VGSLVSSGGIERLKDTLDKELGMAFWGKCE